MDATNKDGSSKIIIMSNATSREGQDKIRSGRDQQQLKSCNCSQRKCNKVKTSDKKCSSRQQQCVLIDQVAATTVQQLAINLHRIIGTTLGIGPLGEVMAAEQMLRR